MGAYNLNQQNRHGSIEDDGCWELLPNYTTCNVMPSSDDYLGSSRASRHLNKRQNLHALFAVVKRLHCMCVCSNFLARRVFFREMLNDVCASSFLRYAVLLLINYSLMAIFYNMDKHIVAFDLRGRRLLWIKVILCNIASVHTKHTHKKLYAIEKPVVVSSE